MNEPSSGAPGSLFSRRRLLQALAGAGVGTLVFQRALAQEAERTGGRVTAEMIAQAEWIADLELSEAERKRAAAAVERARRGAAAMREIDADYGLLPAILFDPAPHVASLSDPPKRGAGAVEGAAARRPKSDEDLAFLPVTELSALLHARVVTSTELTRLYLDRLIQYDPALRCVVSLTEETALAQAARADRELDAGHCRGPLHGVPWGAKDLIAWPGYKTTWGAGAFQDQVIDDKATVARRLEEAGAVLAAKLSLGALAMGDEWFGGRTRNPWNVKEGSSGSSAGSAAATAAGLVGFTIGSETLGSIVSPSRRCGTSGLRPTFGRVSRHGCMPLSWSMDKLGPLCRSIEDCALVFDAIHGADGLDPTAKTRPFHWPPRRDAGTLTVGYFEGEKPPEERAEIKTLNSLGVKLVPIELPGDLPVDAMTIILYVEAATVFDKPLRAGEREGLGRWPGPFIQGQFVTAVEYLRANRLRTKLIAQMEEAIAGVDAYVGGDDLSIANLTGHPTIVLPSGFEERAGSKVPRSITFTGRLYGESDLLALGRAWQQATDFHLARPDMSKVVPEA